MKHLIIPDAHVRPGISTQRFRWLSELIIEEQPEKIICLGDFADMESLCSYDKGKKDYNRRNYTQDLESVYAAQYELFSKIRTYNRQQKKNKKKGYTPELYMLLGNHEERINRAIALDHVLLDGLISTKDLGYEDFGWKVFPFLDVVHLDGIAYSHYFISGIMGRPIGGEHSAASLLAKQHMSCTAGHTHIFDVSRRTRADGRHIRGLVAGCFLDHHEEYAGPANDLWWRGVFIKNNVKDGDYDLEEISLQELRNRYE